MRPAGGTRLVAAIATVACTPIATAGPACVPVGSTALLPSELRETSGIAVSARDPNVFWTHNDGRGEIFAIDRQGRVLSRHRLSVEPNDLEDVAVGECSAGGSCLYFADTGDNAERRSVVRLLRAREPEGRETAVLGVDVFPFRFPDGPRDAEAIFVLPGERVYLVTKGRSDATTVYRYPGALRADTAVLEEIQRLTGAAQPLFDHASLRVS